MHCYSCFKWASALGPTSPLIGIQFSTQIAPCTKLAGTKYYCNTYPNFSVTLQYLGLSAICHGTDMSRIFLNKGF